MIYLIGGPPRCGKTILAKTMAKKLGISWISTDMLEVVSGEYITQAQWNKTHPYSYIRRKYKTNDAFYEKLSPQEIVTAIKQQAKAIAAAIEMAVIYAIKDETDYIIEGYHIEPKLVARLTKTYGEKNITAFFVTKNDAEAFTSDAKKNTAPNDWLLTGTKKEKTFLNVGRMVALLSKDIEKEADKYGFAIYDMSENFQSQLLKVLNDLVRN